MTRACSRVVVLTDRRFWRRSIGSEQRIASLIEHLVRRGDSLTVAYLGRLSADERAALAAFVARLPGLDVRARASGISSRLADLGSALRAALRSRSRANEPNDPHERFRTRDELEPAHGRRANPLLLERSPARRAYSQRLLREIEPRAVIVEFTRLTTSVHPRDPASPGTTTYLIDTHDLLHQRAQRFREHGATVALDVDLREEIEALATYDVILAIQPGDARTIRALLPEKPVLVVPHGIELPMPAPGVAPGPRPIRLGFLGGRDESNRAGLHWFLDHVWSKLDARFGARIELLVAGQICGAWTRTENGMRTVGTLESIDEFWRSIDIAINPVRFGSGLKIKNVEALAYARALLTSEIGAEGLESAAPEGLRIAETAEAWLAILVDWIEDPAQIEQTGRAGRAYAERHFRPAVAFAELDALLDSLASDSPEPCDGSPGFGVH